MFEKIWQAWTQDDTPFMDLLADAGMLADTPANDNRPVANDNRTERAEAEAAAV